MQGFSGRLFFQRSEEQVGSLCGDVDSFSLGHLANDVGDELFVLCRLADVRDGGHGLPVATSVDA